MLQLQFLVRGKQWQATLPPRRSFPTHVVVWMSFSPPAEGRQADHEEWLDSCAACSRWFWLRRRTGMMISLEIASSNYVGFVTTKALFCSFPGYQQSDDSVVGELSRVTLNREVAVLSESQDGRGVVPRFVCRLENSSWQERQCWNTAPDFSRHAENAAIISLFPSPQSVPQQSTSPHSFPSAHSSP
jgi:hypothetical protein